MSRIRHSIIFIITVLLSGVFSGIFPEKTFAQTWPYPDGKSACMAACNNDCVEGIRTIAGGEKEYYYRCNPLAPEVNNDPRLGIKECMDAGGRSYQDPNGDRRCELGAVTKGWEINMTDFLANILRPFTSFLVTIAAFYAGVMGKLFNIAFELTINKGATLITALKGVEIAQRLMRDIMIIGMAGVVASAAFGLIFQTPGPGIKIVVGVMIFGLLQPFSLMIFRFGWSVSNIVSSELYYPIVQLSQIGAGQSDPWGDFTRAGLSGVIMQVVNLQSIRDSKGVEIEDPVQVSISQIMGALFLFVAGTVFLAGALFQIQIFGMGIFLYILAIIMFAKFIFPGWSMPDKWWKQYIEVLTFNPTFLLILIIGIVFILDPSFTKMLRDLEGSAPGTFPQSFLGGSVIIILNYCIAIGIMITALGMAKTMSASMGNQAVKITGKIAGMGIGAAAWTGRNTIGRAGMYTAKSDALKAAAAENWKTGGLKGFAKGLGARTLLKTSDFAQKGSFDARATPLGGLSKEYAGLDLGKAQKDGLKKRIEKRAKPKQEFMEEYNCGATIDTRDKNARAKNDVSDLDEAPDLKESKERVAENDKKIKENQESINKLEGEEKKLVGELSEAEKQVAKLEEDLKVALATGVSFDRQKLTDAETHRNTLRSQIASVKADKDTRENENKSLRARNAGESYVLLQNAQNNLKIQKEKAEEETTNSRRAYVTAKLADPWPLTFESTREAARKIRDGKKTQSDADKLLEIATKEVEKRQKEEAANKPAEEKKAA